MAVTIPHEVSPRKLDLVGIREIALVLFELGKYNQENGKPLSEPRIVALVDRPDFPPPVVLGERTPRLWRRAEVIEWGKNWEQKSGWPAGKPRPPRNG